MRIKLNTQTQCWAVILSAMSNATRIVVWDNTLHLLVQHQGMSRGHFSSGEVRELFPKETCCFDKSVEATQLQGDLGKRQQR